MYVVLDVTEDKPLGLYGLCKGDNSVICMI